MKITDEPAGELDVDAASVALSQALARRLAPRVTGWDGRVKTNTEEWTLLEQFGRQAGGRAKAPEFMSPYNGLSRSDYEDRVFQDIDTLVVELSLDRHCLYRAAQALIALRGCSRAEAYERLADNLRRFVRASEEPGATIWRAVAALDLHAGEA